MAGPKTQYWLNWWIKRGLELTPIFALVALTFLTYWLLQQKIVSDPKAPAPVEHKPDYTLLDFTVRSFDEQGRPRTQLSGKRLDFFPDDETSTVDQPVLRGKAVDSGAVSRVVAERGVSNRDGSEIQFFTQVHATRDGYVLPAKNAQPEKHVQALDVRSEFLHVWVNEERMRSHVLTTIVRGQSSMSADNMELSNYDSTVKLNGKARISLASKTESTGKK